MNYYKEVKSAFDDWATTYESDVVPKLDLRGYSYNELAKTILSYYDKSMDKKSILELGVGTGVLGERVKSLVPSTEIDGLDISSEMVDLIESSPFELVELKKLGISKDYNHYLFALRKGK